MDILKQQIRRARRRLAWQHFCRVLTWCSTSTLLIAAVLVGVDKFRPLGVQPWVLVASAAGLGLVLSGIWTIARRRGELDAALEIDRRFGLRERVSSTWSLGAAERESPAGQALVSDAAKRVARLHVAEKFAVRPGRWAWLPLVPATLAFLVAVFLNPAVGSNPAGGSISTVTQQKQVKNASNVLRRKLTERKKEASQKGLKDAEQLFDKLEQGTKKLALSKTSDRKKGLIELNDLAKELQKRRERLGATEKVKQQFEALKDIQQGPGEKMADALRNGDFQRAQKELKRLAEDFKKGNLDQKAKADLAKQLKQMQQKLKQMAKAHDSLQKELKNQIAEKRAAGQSKEADKLERQLQKLAQQSSKMKQLDKMGEQCAKCAQAMKQGNNEAAMAALDEMQSELGDMQQELDELAMLEDAMDAINDAKDSMNCKKCNGRGCSACRGKGSGDGDGDGLGKGHGHGERPEEKGKTAFYDTQVKQKVGKGAAVITDLVDGPNAKGKVEQAIQTDFESARAAASDPLTGQHLPKSYRDHARKYFDSIRDGK